MKKTIAGACALVAVTAASHPALAQSRADYDTMVKTHAAANGVPEELIHRVIRRESGYRPHLVSKGNIGLMQIKLATARGLGYTGTAEGLRDANTNMTWAVKYLAGAYKVANGNPDRAVGYYASGYYYAAKRQRQNLGTAVAAASTTQALALAQPLSARERRRLARGKFLAPARFDELTASAAAKD